MMPGGMGGLLANLPPGTDSNARLKRFMVVMDSMSVAEMDGRVPLDEARIIRIARGAGAHPQEVVQLIETHKQFDKMIGGMNKAGLLKGGDAAFASKVSRNPGAVMSQLQRSIDPRMLQQMGGGQNLMNLMKGMAAGGGERVCGVGCGGCGRGVGVRSCEARL